MKIVGEISDNEMIAIFLKGEINSDRWAPALLALMQMNNIDKKVIDHPNVTDSQENDYRKRLLSQFRGYGQNTFLFQGFPSDVQWYRVKLNKNEVAQDYQKIL